MDKSLRRPIKLKGTSNYEKPYYTFFRRLRKSVQHQCWIQQKYLVVEIGYFLLLLFYYHFYCYYYYLYYYYYYHYYYIPVDDN